MSEQVSVSQLAADQRRATTAHAVDVRSGRNINIRGGRSPFGSDRAHSRQYRPHRPAAAAPPITDQDSIVVKRHELVGQVTTGEPVRSRESQRTEAELGQEVEIPAETVQKHVDFLLTYVQGLVRAEERQPGIFQDQDFLPEKKFLDKLSFVQADAQGIQVRQVVDQAKIREFLKSGGDAWAETTLAMEEFVLITEMGYGLKERIREKWYHQQSSDALGGTRTAILDQSMHTARTLIQTAGARIGTGLATAAWAIAGTDAIKIDYEHWDALLQVFQTDAPANAKTLLFAFSGVDVDRIGQEGNTTNVQYVSADVTNALQARWDLYNVLGLGQPPSHFFGRDINRNLDFRSLHEWIVNPRVRPEGSRYVSDQRVMALFGEMFDDEVATPGTYLPPGIAPGSVYGRLYLIDMAVRKVRINYAEKRSAIDEAAAEDVRGREFLRDLEAKETAMKSPDYGKEQRERHERTIKEAKESREKVEARRKSLVEDEGSVGKTDVAVRKLEDELVDPKFGVVRTENFGRAIQDRIDALRAQMGTDLAATVIPGPPAVTLQEVLERIATEATAAEDAVRTSWENAATGSTRFNTPFPQEASEAAGRRVEERYARQYPQVRAYDTLVQTAEELRVKQTEYQKAIQDRNGATYELAYADGERDKLQTAITTYGTLIAPPLSLTQVQIQNMPAADIVTQLTTANIPPGATEQERQRFVFQAKGQEFLNRTVILAPFHVTGINALGTIGITPDAILIRNPNDMNRLLSEHYVNVGVIDPATGAVTNDPVRCAEIAAVHVLDGRSGVDWQLRELADGRLAAEIGHYTAIERTAQTQIDALGNMDEARTGVRVTKEAWKKKGEAYSRANSLTGVPRAGIASPGDEIVVRFGEVALVNNADPTLSVQERTSTLPQGALAWYELVYQYRGETNRGEAFAALRRALPEQALADIIARELNLGAPGQPIANVLAAFRGAVAARATRFTGVQMQRAVRALITHVRDHGLALG